MIPATTSGSSGTHPYASATLKDASLDKINKNVYIQDVKSVEFKRWLADRGAISSRRKGRILRCI